MGMSPPAPQVLDKALCLSRPTPSLSSSELRFLHKAEDGRLQPLAEQHNTLSPAEPSSGSGICTLFTAVPPKQLLH